MSAFADDATESDGSFDRAVDAAIALGGSGAKTRAEEAHKVAALAAIRLMGKARAAMCP